MNNQLAAVLCQMAESMGNIEKMATDKLGGGEVTSLIVPITIGDNAPQRFVQRNERRIGLVIHNNSGSALYLAMSNDQVQVGEDYYSFLIPADDHLILDQETLFETYKGEVWGVWEQGAPNDSKALVTELSKEVLV